MFFKIYYVIIEVSSTLEVTILIVSLEPWLVPKNEFWSEVNAVYDKYCRSVFSCIVETEN